MFVRDNSNNPREISRIFVRDASGTPQEISKIYVRDASGVPKLVFDNTVTTVPSLCSDCDVGYVYYFNVGTAATSSVIPTRANYVGVARPVLNQPACTTTSISTTGVRPFFHPVSTLDKTYWKKTSLSYDYVKKNLENNGVTPNEDLSSSVYYRTLEQPLSCNPLLPNFCFCNWFNSAFTGTLPPTGISDAVSGFSYGSGDLTNIFWKALKISYDELTNYPILPGFILIDYKTSNFKSTIVSRVSRPRYKWTDHGRTVTIVDSDTSTETTYVPTGAYDQRYAPGGTCLTGPAQVAATRNSSIYPYYDRFVLLDVDLNTIQNFNSVNGNRSYLDLPCGQEYCVTLFDQEFYKTWAHGTCWNYGAGGTQEFIWAMGNTNDFPASVNCTGSFSYGAPWTNQQITLGSLGTTSGFGDCNIFVDRDLINIPGVGQYYNPYSYLLVADNTATDRTIPVLNAQSDLQDCCTNCFYGPVNDDTTTEDMCREIYQIPPINTQNPNGANLKFFEDISTMIALNTENTTQSASAKVRFTLPMYLTLPAFDTFIVKLKNLTTTQLDDFINGGDVNYNGTQTIKDMTGISLDRGDLLLWKALCDIFGFNLITKELLVTGAIPLSSHSFQYEENRFGVTVSGSCTPSSITYPIGPLSPSFSAPSQTGVSTATNAASLGQYPIIKWDVFGFPTTETTHYVVFEMTASGNRCISSAINLNTIKNNQSNLRAALRGITLQPVNFVCKNLQNSTVPTVTGGTTLVSKTYKFAHPLFIDYLFKNTSRVAGEPPAVSNYDFYRATNVNELTTDQGGTQTGSWGGMLPGVTAIDSNFLVYSRGRIISDQSAYSSCFIYRTYISYTSFLNKYYPLEKFTTTDGIPD